MHELPAPESVRPPWSPDAGNPAAARAAVLDRVGVTEHRMTLADVPTAVLVGGDGPPVVLLHGPGENALWWYRVIPDLLEHHRVVVPDMPGHGDSGVGPHAPDVARVTAWMDALLTRTCPEAPVLIGHALGGAVAARYAIARPDRVARLVLVDTLGLRRFWPHPAFGYRLMRFMARPERRTYTPFLAQCMHDAGQLERDMGDRWEPFVAYYLDDVRGSDSRSAVPQMMKAFGLPRIPSHELASLKVPTALVWGRHDRATPLKVAEDASARYGWPLHVVEASGDDPKLERPEAFLAAVGDVLGTVRTTRRAPR